MTAKQIVDKLTDEIMKEFRLPESLCRRFISDRILWAHVSGVERGRKNNARFRAVMQFSKDGSYIRTFDSLVQAERVTGIRREGIGKVALGKPHHHTAGGFKWEFVDEAKQSNYTYDDEH